MKATRYIVKRDGRVETWSVNKIAEAIYKAFKAEGVDDKLTAIRLADKVEMKIFENSDTTTVEQEHVQDCVEDVLMNSSFKDVAKNYIIYREKRRAIRDMDTTYMINSKVVIDSYLDRSDWRVNENSNVGMSGSGMILHMQGEMQKRYVLNNVYTKKIRDAYFNGYMHIHDLSFGMFPYCSGWSFRDLLLEGFSIENSCAAGPAKHFTAALGQCVNFLGTLQNEWAGAQALNNFDTYLAPFIRHDELDYDQTKQVVQNFLHGINTTSRWGGQCVPELYPVYTPDGWKLYNELKIGDLIYTMNLETGDIELQPIEQLNYYYNENAPKNMVHFTSTASMNPFYFDVTENHRVVNCTDGKFTIVEASQLVGDIANIPTMYCPINQTPIDNGMDLRMKSETIKNHYSGVWCPTVKNGTWITFNPKFPDVKFITGNSPFTNVTLDVTCPKHIAKEPTIIGGKYQDTTYGEYQKEMDMFNKAFVEVMLQGDHNGRVFPYPVPTYNVTEDFPWDNEIGTAILQMTAKYGTPYFQNFINSDLNPEDVRSMCPLHPDSDVMVKTKDGTVHDKTMQECWENKDDEEYQTYYKGEWYPATMTATKSIGCIKITLKNGTYVTMDLRHEQPMRTNIINTPTITVRGSDLEPGMWIPTSMGKYGNEMFIHRTKPDVVVWEQIDTIEQIDYVGDVYCFVVDNKEHLFTLSNGIITHNCRLRMNLNEIRKKTGGLFGAGDLTGSINVTTLNLSKLAYLSQDENEFRMLLKEYADLAKEASELKRKFVTSQFEHNQMPWTKKYLKNGFNGHFSTIGVVGGHEACMNLLHKGIDTEEGTQLMIRTLEYLKDLTVQYQEETGNLYNLEASPKFCGPLCRNIQ